MAPQTRTPLTFQILGATLITLGLWGGTLLFAPQILPQSLTPTVLAPPLTPAQPAGGRPGRPGTGAGVVLETVTMAPLPLTGQGLTTLEAQHSLTIQSAVAGTVLFLAQEGERHQTGDLLLHIDDRDARRARDNAQQDLHDAQQDLERVRELVTRGTRPETDLLTAERNRARAQLALTTAQDRLDEHRVHAPFDGSLGLWDVRVGTSVTPQTALGRFQDTTRLRATVSLPQNVSQNLENGDRLNGVTTGTQQGFEAVVTARDTEANPRTGRVSLRLLIDNPDQNLIPGDTAVIRHRVNGPQHPRLPEGAILWNRNGAFVWIENNGQAQRVEVDIVQRENGHVHVTGPLQEDTLVVIGGGESITPGQTLTLREGTRP